jgi:antitoxin (DNA-binding transcriptional repressor) of toxin-antitoxin stability system
MQRIGVRELRQHASRWLARTAAGESFEVTDRGRLVALLVPPPAGGSLARLEAAGLLAPAEGDLRELEPLPSGTGRSLTEELLAMRAEERY